MTADCKMTITSGTLSHNYSASYFPWQGTNQTKIVPLDASNLILQPGVTSLYGMFQGDAKLASLDMAGWDTSKVADMGATFWGCASLATLDLSGWDTRSVANMSYMFQNDANIKQIRLDQHTDTLIPSIRSDVFPASRNLIVMVEGETTATGGQGSFASDKAEDDNYKVNQATWFKLADRGIIYSGSSGYGMYPPACVSWDNDATSTCTVAGSTGMTPPTGQQLLSWKSTTDNTTYRPGQTVLLGTPSFVTVNPQWGTFETVSALPLTGTDKHQALVKILLLAATLLTLAAITILRNRRFNNSAE